MVAKVPDSRKVSVDIGKKIKIRKGSLMIFIICPKQDRHPATDFHLLLKILHERTPNALTLMTKSNHQRMQETSSSNTSRRWGVQTGKGWGPNWLTLPRFLANFWGIRYA